MLLRRLIYFHVCHASYDRFTCDVVRWRCLRLFCLPHRMLRSPLDIKRRDAICGVSGISMPLHTRVQTYLPTCLHHHHKFIIKKVRKRWERQTDRRTDGRQTVTLRLALDAVCANVNTANKIANNVGRQTTK